MNRTDCNALVEKVYIVWRLESTIQDRKKAQEAWWEFLHDLDLDAVRRVLNLRAMAGGFAPRPGEIRAEVLIGRPPLVAEIWNEIQSVRAKINSGIYTDQPYSPWTAAVIAKMGAQSMGLETNGDRNLLEATLKRVVEERLEECLPPPPPN